MRRFRLLCITATALGILSFGGIPALAQGTPQEADNFYTGEAVSMQKVTFKNQYKMTVAGNLFLPKALDQNLKHPAVIVGHPMGAVKEQSANLYAAKMVEQGFVALSLDLSFWGESEGEPRNAVSPDIYAEDFSAAVDFLGTRPFVDREQVGAIGICGSGSFVLSAAKIDPRLKAIATVSMYDMGAANRNGLRHALTPEQRKQILREASEQRYVEFSGGETKYTSGSVHELHANSTPVEREFYDFYRTLRGEFTPKGSSPLLTTHPTLTSNVKFMNFYPFADLETISPRPLLFIAGEKAHSMEFSEEAYRLALAAVAILLFYVQNRPLNMILVMAWGFLFGFIPVSWSAWIARTLAHKAELAGGISVAVTQFSIGLMAAVGGLTFDDFGISGIFLIAVTFLLAAAGLVRGSFTLYARDRGQLP